MYKILPQLQSHQIPDSPISESSSMATIPLEFLDEAVFAGDSFWGLEAAFGRVDGVVKTATGYCGGTLKKPTHREVREARTGHTEAVKVIYDNRKFSYRSLCDLFWETHDPTNKEYLGFGVTTHHRSAIYYLKEDQRKQAQESKIRRQMKLNKRIVTKIIPLDSEFFFAENQHQKYYLQKNWRLCESLNLRSTEQFVESNIACKLNGILAMDKKTVADNLKRFMKSFTFSKQVETVCEGMVEDLCRNEEE
ncbi:hypothetical protein HHK36_030023 [Tetracentron sinense]|uniref:peptide-methionine (S)-S-oxide reductase n=1 Tax=Tetracentron sinense TaxID=13715 RepID=A0A834YCQ9_TETSI|nr:hypothetical protein HHK36_030023 [Tetracentron sinense]